MSEHYNQNNHSEATRNPVDNTTWEFLKPGWWFIHVVAIVALLYLGKLFWPIF